jgi:signal transduction histidine kinase
VLANFLSNATKFSNVDSVIVLSLKMSPMSNSSDDEPTKALFTFAVKDSGPGISIEDQKMLFKHFSQLQPKQANSSGLGLALAKEFNNILAGSIWVCRSLIT